MRMHMFIGAARSSDEISVELTLDRSTIDDIAICVFGCDSRSVRLEQICNEPELASTGTIPVNEYRNVNLDTSDPYARSSGSQHSKDVRHHVEMEVQMNYFCGVCCFRRVLYDGATCA